MTPILSVLMPTFRGERFVGEALASLATDRDAPLELVVVDDGSDDATLEIVSTYASRLAIRLVDGPRAKNWVASTNRALDVARGRYCCFLHQDDVWLPGRYRAIQAAIASFPDVRLFVQPTRFVDESGRSLGTWRTPFRGNRSLASNEVFESLLVQNWLGIPSPVFRTDDARALAGLDESLWYTADWNLWLGLARLGAVAHGATPTSAFRIHGGSQTVTRSGDADGFRAQMTTVLERHLGDPLVADAARPSIEAAARFAIETNVALASVMHRRRPDLGAFARASVAMRPESLRRFARDSRIADRIGARLVASARARFGTDRASDGTDGAR